MSSYSDLSIAELRALAKEKKLSGYSTLRKQEIIALLTEADAGSVPAKTAEPAPAKPAEPAKTEPESTKNETPDAAPAAPEMKSAPAEETSAASETKTAPENKPAAPEAKPAARVVRRVVASTGDAGARPDRRPGGNRQDNAGSRAEGRQESRADNADSRTDNRADNRRADAARNADPTDSGIVRRGIFEICSDNYGFLRNDNYLPSEQDVYVNPSMIRRYNLTTGDVVEGTLKVQSASGEKYVPLHHITKINDKAPELAMRRRRFDRLTPVFPHERLHLEYPGCNISMRMVDMLSPIGKGQRGMIVSQPKAGKTTLLKQIAKSILTNHKNVHMIILLIDERPEEVTDFKEFVAGTSAEVIYSTFDEEPNRHRRVSEMTMERAKRLVEYGEDVVILLDSITRLARAYNLTCVSSGRTLSGGLDPNALFMPKKFFGAARCMKEGGSLTILATALVETGSRMDDVVYEEFKGTGNMELVLNRDLSERRIFPAIDLPKSSTRREDLLLNPEEQRANVIMRKAFNGKDAEGSVEKIISLFTRTRNNAEFTMYMQRLKL